MTRREALKVKKGDMLIFREWAVFKVVEINQSFINRDIVFYANGGTGLVGYPHKMCRRYEDDRAEESDKTV